MEEWAEALSQCSFVKQVPADSVHGYAVSHEDAAANIDLLSEQLGRVLETLQSLEPEGEAG